VAPEIVFRDSDLVLRWSWAARGFERSDAENLLALYSEQEQPELAAAAKLLSPARQLRGQ
jgi:hypothetical protein